VKFIEPFCATVSGSIRSVSGSFIIPPYEISAISSESELIADT
jgi:hypothetical protein